MDCVDKCDYNSSYTVKCENVDIPVLSEEQHKSLIITQDMGNNLYFGYISEYPVWVKYTGSTLGSEICMQIKASSAGLSPKILGYWKCSKINFGYIVMEPGKSNPRSYSDEDDLPIDVDLFYDNILLKIAELNDLGISHGNIENNIIYSDDGIMFVNFEESTFIEDSNKYTDLGTFTYEFSRIKKRHTIWEQYDKYGSLVELVKHIKDIKDRPENSLEKHFKCHSDDSELDCSILDLAHKIPQLTQDELNSIVIGPRIGEGTYGQVYSATLDKDKVAVKYFRGNSLNEVCIQEHVAKYKLAPKVYSFWKCKENKYNLLVMDQIRGETLGKFIRKDNDKFILGVLSELSYLVNVMNFELGIRHNDLHTNNIIFDKEIKKLTFIDFGLAVKLPNISNLQKYYDLSYSEIYSNQEYSDDLYQYFYDLSMMMNRAAIMIQKNIPSNMGSYKLVDIITINNLDDYSGWFRIFKEYRRQNKEDLTPNKLRKIIQNLFESGMSSSMPRNVITKFHLCSNDNTNIKLDCVSDKLWTKEINQLRKSDLETLEANSLRIKDRTITLYDGKWGKIYVSIIYLIESSVSMKQQICFHAMASDFSISPEIYGYWKCPETNFTLLATVYIEGERLNRYISQKNNKTTFLRLLSAVLTMNLNLRIINENIVYNNVIMSDKSVNILSYPRSKKLEESVLLNDISGKKRNDGIYIDLVSISNMFGLGGDKKMKTYILENKLNQSTGWRKIYQTVYSDIKVIPQSSDIYNFVRTKLE